MNSICQILRWCISKNLAVARCAYVFDNCARRFSMNCERNPLIYANQRERCSLFFHAAADTVMELSRNPAHLGGTPGFISNMHTWGSNLSCHPHIHMLCTGDGLDADRNCHQKKAASSCLEKRWPHFSKGNSCPDSSTALLLRLPLPDLFLLQKV